MGHMEHEQGYKNRHLLQIKTCMITRGDGVSSPLVGSPIEPVIPIRCEDDKPC